MRYRYSDLLLTSNVLAFGLFGVTGDQYQPEGVGRDSERLQTRIDDLLVGQPEATSLAIDGVEFNQFTCWKILQKCQMGVAVSADGKRRRFISDSTSVKD